MAELQAITATVKSVSKDFKTANNEAKSKYHICNIVLSHDNEKINGTSVVAQRFITNSAGDVKENVQVGETILAYPQIVKKNDGTGNTTMWTISKNTNTDNDSLAALLMEE